MTGVEFVLAAVFAAPVIRTLAERIGEVVAWAGERRTDRLAR